MADNETIIAIACLKHLGSLGNSAKYITNKDEILLLRTLDGPCPCLRCPRSMGWLLRGWWKLLRWTRTGRWILRGRIDRWRTRRMEFRIWSIRWPRTFGPWS
uniref:Uncharacterized protein n=1 Tax=Magallana gigas TaxID=29159 RepID=A0A8W8NZI6_MAGGI